MRRQRIPLLISALGLFAGPVYSQVQPWARTFGGAGSDALNAVAERDGAIFGCGFTDSTGSGLLDAWIVSFDRNGVPLWQTVLGGQTTDEMYDIVATGDGGCVVAGYTFSFGSGQSDGWLIRLDAAGDVVWQRTYGGPGFEGFGKISVSPNGFYLAGATGFQQGEQDIWLLEIDAKGEVLWQRSVEGNKFDQVSSLLATPDGFMLVANSNSDFADRPADIPFHRPLLARFDTQGQVQWAKTYNFSAGDLWNHIEPVSTGGYVVGGEIIASGFLRGDFWIVRLDEDGNVQWDTRLGDNFNTFFFDGAIAVREAPDGGFLTAGSTATGGAGSQDFWVVKVDAEGEHLWDRTLGTSEFEDARAAIIVDGGLLIAGSGRLFFPEPVDGVAMMVGLDGDDGLACDLSAPGDPNIWTEGLEIDQVELKLKETAVVGMPSSARAVELLGGRLLCGRPTLTKQR